MLSQRRKILAAVISCAALILIAALLAVGIPWLGAGLAMPENRLLSAFQTDSGGLELTWPEADGAEKYEVRVSGGEKLYSAGNSLTLTSPSSESVKVDVYAVKGFRAAGLFDMERKMKVCGGTLPLNKLPISLTESLASAEDKTLSLAWSKPEGSVCRIYLYDAGTDRYEPLSDHEGDRVLLRFGEELQTPEYDKPTLLLLRAGVTGGGWELFGPPAETVTVDREELLGTELELECRKLDDTHYSFTWNETRGDCYEFQLWSRATGEWVTLERVERDGQRSYDTGRLGSSRDLRFRVVACGDTSVDDSGFSAVSDEAEVSTPLCVQYATVWPLPDLPLFPTTEMAADDAIATIPTGSALCVLEEKDGCFYVRYGADYGWIDSRYCLIDLPEYLGDLCSYDVTNSYSSKYMIHKYSIPDVTGTVVAGYENVRLKSGECLAPLLYPTANKLRLAAEAALEEGCRIKIYDSFRPAQATQSISGLTGRMLENPIPDQPYIEPVEGEEPELVTYRDYMTGDNFEFGNFLAGSASYHNLGVALDMTIEDAQSGEEIPMQTAMHDLSWFSSTGQNNSGAWTLAKLMYDKGFGGLYSEWWHFQDNETSGALRLPFKYAGVSVEGWKYDGEGWRYQRADGTFITGDSETLDGVEYHFDAAGYADY